MGMRAEQQRAGRARGAHQQEALRKGRRALRPERLGDAVEGAAVEARAAHDSALDDVDRGADGAADQPGHEAGHRVYGDAILQVCAPQYYAFRLVVR